jgi:alpha-L-fucosidase
MGWPEGENKQVVIRPLSTNSPQKVGSIENVELLGYGKVEFKRDEDGLKVTLPNQKPCEHACTLKISGSGLV